MYFFTIIESIAPFFDMVVKIMFDIRPFMLVMAIHMTAFAACFYFVGQNQMDYDVLSDDEITRLHYKDFYGAFMYITNMVLGDEDRAPFDFG